LLVSPWSVVPSPLSLMLSLMLLGLALLGLP